MTIGATNGGAFRAVAFLAFSGIIDAGISNPNEPKGSWHGSRLGVQRDKAQKSVRRSSVRFTFTFGRIDGFTSSKFFSRPVGLHKNAAWVSNPGQSKEAAMSSQLNSNEFQKNPVPTDGLNRDQRCCYNCDNYHMRVLQEFIRTKVSGCLCYGVTGEDLFEHDLPYPINKDKALTTTLVNQLLQRMTSGQLLIDDYLIYTSAEVIFTFDMATPDEVPFIFIHRTALEDSIPCKGQP